MGRLAELTVLALMLCSCAGPAEATPNAQTTRIAIATATAHPTATFTAEEARRERFLPLLLTLDDFNGGVTYGEQSLTDSVTSGIQTHANFRTALAMSLSARVASLWAVSPAFWTALTWSTISTPAWPLI